MITVLLVLFFVLFPTLVIFLCNKYSFLDKIGAVVVCYVVGALVGNIGILPAGFDKVQGPLMPVSYTHLTLPTN